MKIRSLIFAIAALALLGCAKDESSSNDKQGTLVVELDMMGISDMTVQVNGDTVGHVQSYFLHALDPTLLCDPGADTPYHLNVSLPAGGYTVSVNPAIISPEPITITADQCVIVAVE